MSACNAMWSQPHVYDEVNKIGSLENEHRGGKVFGMNENGNSKQILHLSIKIGGENVLTFFCFLSFFCFKTNQRTSVPVALNFWKACNPSIFVNPVEREKEREWIAPWINHLKKNQMQLILPLFGSHLRQINSN